MLVRLLYNLVKISAHICNGINCLLYIVIALVTTCIGADPTITVTRCPSVGTATSSTNSITAASSSMASRPAIHRSTLVTTRRPGSRQTQSPWRYFALCLLLIDDNLINIIYSKPGFPIDMTTLCYCAVLLCCATVLCYSAVLLCCATVLCYCAVLLCYCAVLLCCATVLCYCALLLCCATVLCYCAVLLCCATVLCYLALCTRNSFLFRRPLLLFFRLDVRRTADGPAAEQELLKTYIQHNL